MANELFMATKFCYQVCKFATNFCTRYGAEVGSKLTYVVKLAYLVIWSKAFDHMVKGIVNAFGHMEFCLVLNLTTTSAGGKWAVLWPPICKFATNPCTRSVCLLPAKVDF